MNQSFRRQNQVLSWVVAAGVGFASTISIGAALAQDEKAKTEAKGAADTPRADRSPKKDAPKRKVTREEYMKRPGAKREPIPNFLVSKTMQADEPTRQMEEALETMRREGAQVNKAIVSNFAKYRVYLLTRQNEEANLSAINAITLAEIGKSKNQEYTRTYKQALVAHVKEVLDNSLVTQINALYLLTQLFGSNRADASRRDEVNVADPVPVFVSMLEDPKRQDAIYFLALRGLENAKRANVLSVESEAQAVAACMRIVAQPGVQEVLVQEIASKLGVFGRAYSGIIPEEADVAFYLAGVALNQEYKLRTRVEAAIAMCQLRVQQVTNMNRPLYGYVIGKVLKEVFQNHLEGRISDDWFKAYVGDFFLAIDANHKQPGHDPVFQELRDIVAPLNEQINKKGAEVKLEFLDGFLRTRENIRDRRLTSQTKELVLAAPADGAAAKPDAAKNPDATKKQ